nr:FecR domain-containing protein [Membranihabitans maritimus]
MFFAKGQGEIFYSTENGEILEIQLPDNSLVKLNANSTLKWRNDSENGRLVELSGEAFFNVKHTIDDQKFVVETDQSKITVLGTSFNINSRENDKIFLEEGSIQLEKSGEKSPEMVLLRPGESAIVEKAGPAIQVSVNKMVENEAAWKDGLLQFSDMKLATIIERLEEIYGKDIKVVDTTVLDTEMEFTLPYANWEITGQALALAVGLTLEDNGKIIELK